MTVTHVIRCNECGQKMVYSELPERQGWLEVWMDEDVSLDFCDQECLVEYFTTKEEDDE